MTQYLHAGPLQFALPLVQITALALSPVDMRIYRVPSPLPPFHVVPTDSRYIGSPGESWHAYESSPLSQSCATQLGRPEGLCTYGEHVLYTCLLYKQCTNALLS